MERRIVIRLNAVQIKLTLKRCARLRRFDFFYLETERRFAYLVSKQTTTVFEGNENLQIMVPMY